MIRFLAYLGLALPICWSFDHFGGDIDFPTACLVWCLFTVYEFVKALSR